MQAACRAARPRGRIRPPGWQTLSVLSATPVRALRTDALVVTENQGSRGSPLARARYDRYNPPSLSRLGEGRAELLPTCPPALSVRKRLSGVPLMDREWITRAEDLGQRIVQLRDSL